VTLGDGLTEFGGDLKECVRLYTEKDGIYSEHLKPYVDRIGKYPSLCKDENFLYLLKHASEEDPLMRETQDEVFDKLYWLPAKKWADDHGFKGNPLSLLVIYDSFVQSGQIFMFLRNEFEEPVPSNGGDEHTWIKEYIRVRLFWLSNHTNAAVRESAYRMKTYKKLADAGNWNLDGAITTDNDCTTSK
jgi:chitosanase